MALIDLLLSYIDLRAFGNLWFWLLLALVWSGQTYWVMGVPWDMLTRAARADVIAMADVETLAHLHARRRRHMMAQSGAILLALAAALVAALWIWGFSARLQVSQAFFFLITPLLAVRAVQLRLAQAIVTQDLRGASLLKRLRRHRFLVQLIGMITIFLTSMWGMFQVMTSSALGY